MLPDWCPWSDHKPVFLSLHDQSKYLPFPDFLREAIDTDNLTDFELSVLSYRLGLNGEEWHSPEETIDHFRSKISEEALQTLEHCAFAKHPSMPQRLHLLFCLSYPHRSLTPRQEKLLVMRWGLWDGCPRSHEELAEHFGTTVERIRNAERFALSRLLPCRHMRRAYSQLSPTDELKALSE